MTTSLQNTINSVEIPIDWKVTELNSFIAEILGMLTKAFH